MSTISPMAPATEQVHRHHRRRIVWPLVAAALLVILVLVIVGVLSSVAQRTVVHRTAVHTIFTPSVKASLWHPNPGYYCAGLQELPGAQSLFIATMANSAPTAASRAAVVAYYNDVARLNPTAGDVARIVASYPCP